MPRIVPKPGAVRYLGTNPEVGDAPSPAGRKWSFNHLNDLHTPGKKVIHGSQPGSIKSEEEHGERRREESERPLSVGLRCHLSALCIGAYFLAFREDIDLELPNESDGSVTVESDDPLPTIDTSVATPVPRGKNTSLRD
ncbi:hypothetical protein MRX96_006159 [Rhipicephalus microplus]